MKNYSLLITSCDGFEDVWSPFFTLYEKFWNDQDLDVYLITEGKVCSYKNLKIISTCVGVNESKRLTWSEAFIRSLHKINTDIVLIYMDDFFIKEKVDIEKINEVARIMNSDNSIDAFYLSVAGPSNCFDDHLYPGFKKVNQFSSYKSSMMACMWRKDTLLQILDKTENAWMFELYGTKRCHAMDLNMYKVASKSLEPIRYVNTGITKGRWNPEVTQLFDNNHIQVDLMKRGFFEVKNKWIIKYTTFKTLAKQPRKFFYYYVLYPFYAVAKYMFTSRT